MTKDINVENYKLTKTFLKFAEHIVATSYDHDRQSPETKHKHLRADIRCWSCGEYTLGEVDEGPNHLRITYPERPNHRPSCIVLEAEQIIKLLEGLTND
jgi:hypothetical protein